MGQSLLRTVVAAVLLAGPAAAESLSFQTSARLSAVEAELTGEWVMIAGVEPQELLVEVKGSDAQWQEMEFWEMRRTGRYWSEFHKPGDWSPPRPAPDLLSFSVARDRSNTSVFVLADSIAIHRGSHESRLVAAAPCTWAIDTPEESARKLFPPSTCGAPDAVVVAVDLADQGASPMRLEARGVREVIVHNLVSHCKPPADACPHGGYRQVSLEAQLNGEGWRHRSLGYARITGVEEVTFGGRPGRVALGASAVSVHLDGTLRLPLAQGATCPSGSKCVVAADQTLTVAGQISLVNLTGRESHNRFSGQLLGGFYSMRLDEAAVPMDQAASAAVAFGITALIAAMAKALFLGLTRKRGVLGHPNRRKLHGAILAHPGATFRELLRHTDLPAGTARHHLQVLKREAAIQEYQHKCTLRYFENHGRFDDSWNTVVLLREGGLRKLHAWLRNNPGAYQKEIVAEASTRWGWSRSTTQHRLQRLVGEGLVQVRPQGRLKCYEAFDAAPTPG